MPARRPSLLLWIAISVPVAVVVVGIYVIFFRGLARKPVASPPDTVAAATGDDAPFVYAKARRRRMPPPARFDAPLPADREELERFYGGDERFPPFGHVMSRLCAGDERMLTRFQTAVESARPEGASARELIELYAHMFRSCEMRRPCDWLRGHALAETLAPSAREVYWLALAGCADEPAATFARPDAPARAVIAWHGGRDPEGTPPWWPPLARAVIEIAADPETDTYELRSAVYEMLRTRDPAAETALLRVVAAATEPDRRLQIALAAGGARTSAVRALHRRACRSEPLDSACRPEYDEGDPAEEERAFDDGERPLAIPGGRKLDPAVARSQARLTELGLLDGPASRDNLEEGAYDLMATARRAILFDVETGVFPNQHDELLADVAELVRPALAGVVFEEIPPDDPDGDDGYTLRAYLDGTRYEITAENLEDWYDLEAVLGLINTLVRERKSDLGCLTLRPDGQTAQVVCGPRPGLRAAVAEGLLVIDEPGEAARQGKD